MCVCMCEYGVCACVCVLCMCMSECRYVCIVHEYMCMYGVCVHSCVLYVSMCVYVCLFEFLYETVCGGQKRLLNLLRLEAQAVMNHMIRAMGTEPGSFARTIPMLNNWASSPALQCPWVPKPMIFSPASKFMCINVFLARMYMHHMYVWCLQMPYRTFLDTLELEL